MTTIDWRDVWYVKGCCTIGTLCAAHLMQHRAKCGWPEKQCDVCETPVNRIPLEAESPKAAR